MKLISFAVPSYNSQNYLKKCIESLLVGGEDVEIIIVNDGSTDNTGDIADEYRRRYPGIIRVVHKDNGGHGSGINVGLQVASGLYYKVVDSDDWLDSKNLLKFITDMKERLASNSLPDLYITNFIYDHAADNQNHVSEYTKKIPVGKICGWNEVKSLHFSHMLLMHSLFYRRKILLQSGVVLPEHTFYVDNIFAYKPLPFVKTLCYLDLDLYHYFIGRADQSVNINNFVGRYEQQISVMNIMLTAYRLEEIKRLPKGLSRYMWHSLQAIMMITIFFASADYSPARKKHLKKLWDDLKKQDRALYRRMKYWSYSTFVNFLPWRLRGFVLKKGYFILCKKIKFG
jgi:hypothetical protein